MEITTEEERELRAELAKHGFEQVAIDSTLDYVKQQKDVAVIKVEDSLTSEERYYIIVRDAKGKLNFCYLQQQDVFDFLKAYKK